MIKYRRAHKLYLKGHYFLARWISQRAARKTGIEIHPGATIDTSTGGADFVLMAIHKAKPHISVGKIIIVMDFIIVIIGGILMHGNIDKIIYGLIGTYILSFVVDKLMYGVDAGKLALIVTEKGPQIAAKIDELSQRGATLIKAEGSYTGREKEVLMCACNNKEMHTIQEAVKKVDSSAFLVTMESNEVRGKGFKPI